jgi:urease accessory protein UreH
VDSPRAALRIVAAGRDEPALRSDCRATDAIGRTARLDLVFERRRGRTMLTHGYAEPPLRIARVFDLDGAAYAILVCAGPGVFGGDVLVQSVRVRPGACVVLTSQSALQVHPSAPSLPSHASSFQQCGTQAILRSLVTLDEDAELHCHWDPVIPFARARLDQRVDVQMAESSRLYWSDAVMAGRVGRGEAWQFATYAHELAAHVGGRAAYLERYCLTPGERQVERAWSAGRATHMATALVRHPAATSEAVEAIHRSVTGSAGVSVAVDLLEPSLVLARFMAADGASFARARASYRERTLDSIFGRPELAGRK